MLPKACAGTPLRPGWFFLDKILGGRKVKFVKRETDAQMNNKLKAILIGGPNDGQTRELDEAKPEIEIAFRMQERDGQMKVKGVVKYKLKSNGSPLQYEFVDSN